MNTPPVRAHLSRRSFLRLLAAGGATVASDLLATAEYDLWCVLFDWLPWAGCGT